MFAIPIAALLFSWSQACAAWPRFQLSRQGTPDVSLQGLALLRPPPKGYLPTWRFCGRLAMRSTVRASAAEVFVQVFFVCHILDELSRVAICDAFAGPACSENPPCPQGRRGYHIMLCTLSLRPGMCPAEPPGSHPYLRTAARTRITGAATHAFQAAC